MTPTPTTPPLAAGWQDAAAAATLFAAALLLWAPGLGSGSIVNGDDGFYAVVIRALAGGADPGATLGWRMPVFYYFGAFATLVLGEGELALHLPSLLFGCATVLATYGVARVLVPDRRDVAFWGAALLLCTTQMFMFARRVRGLDLCFDTWMLLGLALAVTARGRLAVWGAVGGLVGLAFLTKSVVVVVFAPAYALYWWRDGHDLRARTRSAAVVAGAAVAVVAAWFGPLLLTGQTWGLRDHFERHVVDRATGAPLVGEVEPWTYYLDTLFAFEGVFAAAAIAAVALLALRAVRGSAPHAAVLSITVTTFVAFTAASSKVSHYILPAYPALALGVGMALGELPRVRAWLVHGVGAVLAAAALLFSPLAILESWGDADYAPSSKAGALAARERLPESGRLYIFNEYHAAALYYFDGPTLLLTTDPAFAAQYDATAGFVRDVTHVLMTPESIPEVFGGDEPACLLVSADRDMPGLRDYLSRTAEATPFEGGWLYCTR